MHVRSSDERWQRRTSGERDLPCAACGADVVVSEASMTGAIARLERGSGRLIPVSDGPNDDPLPVRLSGGSCSTSRAIAAGHSALRHGRMSLAARHFCFRAVRFARWRQVGLRQKEPGARRPVDESLGGAVHDVIDTETVCRPGWSSSQTLWVSRRGGKGLVWTEWRSDGGRRNGQAGWWAHTIARRGDDPTSPVEPELRVRHDRRRSSLLAERYLNSRSASLGKRCESR